VEKQAIPRFTIIEAPSVLGRFPNGVETLPDALLAKGFGERLEAQANDPKRAFPSRRFLVVLRCDQFRPNGFGTSVQTSRKK
jgi:hypothetical protein